jgi:hypothetical protein
MNVYHWILVGIFSLAFVCTLYLHGSKKKEQYYNARSAFWTAAITIALVILSAQ